MIAFLLLGKAALKRGILRLSLIGLRRKLGDLRALDWVLLTLLAGVLMTTFLIAWIAPPNTTDSLHYHMSRVAHWAQNKSLRHYPTAYEPQIWSPIWAELAILNFRVLYGNDKLANLVQWFSMVGSLVAVTGIIRMLRYSRSAQWVAAAFVLSVPMGILQASSTQTDYVTGYWLVALAYWIVLAAKRPLQKWEWGLVGLTTGLGMLTKGTFYLYSAPLLVWLVAIEVSRSRLRSVMPLGYSASLAILLNLGFWARNIITYGGPLGPKEWVGGVTRFRLLSGELLTSLVEQVALNMATPSERMNDWIESTVHLLSERVAGAESQFSLIWSWNHEDIAGNPLHIVLVILSVVVILLNALRLKNANKVMMGYLAALIGAAIMFSSLLEFNQYGTRYHLSLLVMAAPLFAEAVYITPLRRLSHLIALLLILSTLPWLVLNRSRPLIGRPPHTMTASILHEPPSEVLFANWWALEEDYVSAANVVRRSGCKDVGMLLDSHDLEYAFWWLLDAPESGFELRVLETYPHLTRYLDPTFKPCVILCTICGDRVILHGLPRVASFGSISIFAGEGYDRIR